MNQLATIPPQEVDLEAAVLGGILLNKDSFFIVSKILEAETFYKDAHKIIFQCISDMFDNSEHIDLLTVTSRLRANGTLKKVGDAFYITDLTSKVDSPAHIETHAALVKQAWIKRCLIATGASINAKGYNGKLDALTILDEAIAEMNTIVTKIQQGRTINLKEVAIDVINKASYNLTAHELLGIPSGIPSIDNFTSGWNKPDLIIIAARPSMGKTALVLQMALNASLLFKKKIAVFSLEMSAEQCMQRLLSTHASIPLSRIRKGQVTEKLVLQNKGEEIINSPLSIDDTPGLTILQLRAKCYLLLNTIGLDMIIVDYLQLMEGPEKNREQQISRISRGLKHLAKEFNIPVIALSQLSRKVEERPNKEPILSDLRESGSIEQDADMVGFLYRPEYYQKLTISINGTDTNTQNLGMLIWAKNRNGPLNKIPLKFIGTYTRFTDWDTGASVPLVPNEIPIDFTVPTKERNTPF